MSFPVDARYETRLSGATTVKSAWANASDDALNGVHGGTRGLVRLTVDGIGASSGRAASGSILVLSGTVIAPTLSSSGNITAALTVTANTLTASGSVQSYGTVLGTKHISDAGNTGLELRSGTGVFSYQAVFKVRASSGASVFDFGSIPVASGKAVYVTARGVGVTTTANWSGAMAHMIAGGAYSTATALTSLGPNTINYSAAPTASSGFLGSVTIGSYLNSGTIVFQANAGASGGTVDWTVFADITTAPV
jgi:hypothetical protein